MSAIPQGRWLSYGDVADAVGSAAQPIGNYLRANPVKNAHRVLRSNGSVSDNFAWLDANDSRDVREVLQSEGLAFDDNGRADPAKQWKTDASLT